MLVEGIGSSQNQINYAQQNAEVQKSNNQGAVSESSQNQAQSQPSKKSLQEQSDKLSSLVNEPKTNPVAEAAFVKAVEEANKKLVGPNIELNIKVHEETKRISVKMINQETGEIVREFPPEKLLDMLADICSPQGKIIDEKR